MTNTSVPLAFEAARFEIIDYILLCGILIMSCSIGIYYSCTGTKQKTTREFFLGNRSMTVFPVTLSLLATFVSATSLLGVTSEIYTFGSQHTFVVFGCIFVFPAVIYFFLPVYYDLGITSVNEYLERRFNKFLRKFSALIYIVQTIFFLAVIIYSPSLALSHVTGMHFWISVVILVGICTIYTTIGGIKAVMWTDVLQCLILIVALFVIIIKGTHDVGGFQTVWQTSQKGNRIEFLNYSADLRVRHTIWTQSIGVFFVFLPTYAVNQAQVQRYLSAHSMKAAKIAIWGNYFGWFGINSCCAIIGLILYTRYHDCDPATLGIIKRNDQLLPLFAGEVLGSIPGFTGLFISGLLSGSLSTLSTGFNSLAAVTLEDFVKSLSHRKITEARATVIVKFLIVGYSFLCLLCIGLVDSFTTISEAAIGILGLFGGPTLGLYILGMFFPWTNSWGAIAGVTFGLIQSIWISVGSRMVKWRFRKLPVSIEGCISNHSTISTLLSNDDNFTSLFTTDASFSNSSLKEIHSTFLPENDVESPVDYLYSVSYVWYSLISCFVTVIVGLITSFCTGPNRAKNLDPNLLSPPSRKLMMSLPKKWRTALRCDILENTETETINKADIECISLTN